MAFIPPCCPYPECPSHRDGQTFSFARKGVRHRLCDARRVQRFRCNCCQRYFSTQSFRLDRGLRKPWLDIEVARLLCAKTTLRKIAEILAVKRRTVERRLERYGPHAEAFHRWRLSRHRNRCGGLSGCMQLDELETFERDRRLCPLTVPVLIERKSLFLVGVAAASLPARGNLPEIARRRLEARQRRGGRRRGRSSVAVREVIELWHSYSDPATRVELQSDRKRSYPGILKRTFAGRSIVHQQFSSKAPRTPRNPLFPINFTNALLRDSISRLVRRNWAASKLRSRLVDHLWIFAAFRNYIRDRTRRERGRTAAMKLGIERAPWTWGEWLRWRAPFFTLHRAP